MNAAADPPYRHCLGARGWQHPDWRGWIYPEDVPEDWWLAAYNVRFPCVLLPESLWRAAAPELLLRWRDDTLARFRFLPEGRPGPGDRQRLLPLADRLGPWVDPADPGPEVLFFDAGFDPRAMARRLAGPESAACILCRDADAGAMERMEQLLALL